MSKVNVANNPIGSYPVKVTREGTGADIVNVQHVIVDSGGGGGGDATAANQVIEIASLQLLDDVVATTAAAIPTKGFAISGTDGTNARVLKTDTSGELQIDVLSSALPSGAATAARQDTGNSSLANIDAITGTILGDTSSIVSYTSYLPGIDGYISTTSNNLASVIGTDASTFNNGIRMLGLNGGIDNYTIAVDGSGQILLGAGSANIGSITSITSSITPGTAAANLGKAEDAVHGTGDTGVMALAVRTDTSAALAGTTGDYIPLTTDALGKLWVAGSQTEDAVAASGDRGMFNLSVRQDTASATGANGDYVAITSDALGKLWTADCQTEDAVAASGDRGSFVLSVANTGGTSLAANGDYIGQAADLAGRTLVSMRTPTATLSNVAGSAASVTILAANSNRTGATIVNDSTAILYLKFGATASTSSYTVKMVADAYYEVPFGYSGVIDGIWASATGNARVTELT